MSVATKIVGQQSWDTDAEFRADVLAIHNALVAAGGLVQTADTGQTDFVANTKAAGGYTVYRFDDSDQAIYPLFLRIDWSAPNGVRPGITFTLGTGSNGAGTITGVIRSAANGVVCGTALGATGSNTSDYYVSVGPGYVYIVLNVIATSPNTIGAMLLMERSTDEAGVIHPEEGVVVFSTAPGRAYSIHPTGFTAIGPLTTASPLNAGLEHPFWDDIVATDIGMMPASYMMRAKLRFHRMTFLKPARVSYGVPFNADHLGATRVFMSIENNWYHGSDASGWCASARAGSALVLPWV